MGHMAIPRCSSPTPGSACGVTTLASRSASAVLAVFGLLLSGAALAAHDDASTGSAFLTKFCGDCHNATDWAGGVAFDTMSPDNVSEDAGVWEEAVKKLRGRLMPPPGEAQP